MLETKAAVKSLNGHGTISDKPIYSSSEMRTGEEIKISDKGGGQVHLCGERCGEGERLV